MSLKTYTLLRLTLDFINKLFKIFKFEVIHSFRGCSRSCRAWLPQNPGRKSQDRSEKSTGQHPLKNVRSAKNQLTLELTLIGRERRLANSLPFAFYATLNNINHVIECSESSREEYLGQQAFDIKVKE